MVGKKTFSDCLFRVPELGVFGVLGEVGSNACQFGVVAVDEEADVDEIDVPTPPKTRRASSAVLGDIGVVPTGFGLLCRFFFGTSLKRSRAVS